MKLDLTRNQCSHFALTVLSSSLTLVALSACGGGSGSGKDDTSPSKQGEDVRNGGGSGTTKPGPTPSPTGTPSTIPTSGPSPKPTSTPVADDRPAFEFTFRGVPVPIKAKVSRGGSIEVLAWPKLMNPTLVLSRARDFSQLTSEFCSGVEANARAGRVDAVRNRGSFVASIEAIPVATIDFANTARRGALEALGGVGAPRLVHAPELTRVKARVVLGEGSIAALVGAPETLEAIFTRVPVSLEFGTWNGEIAAMDLLCDLRAGKAKIVFEAETDEPIYSPASEVSSLSGPT